MSEDTTIVIASAARTPVGRFRGNLMSARRDARRSGPSSLSKMEAFSLNVLRRDDDLNEYNYRPSYSKLCVTYL